MAKTNHFSTMVGENFEILKYEMAKINHFSTMVGEPSEILRYEMSEFNPFLHNGRKKI